MPQANIPEPLTQFCDGSLNSSSVVISLIGAGGQAGQNDAANLLKPALARGGAPYNRSDNTSRVQKIF
ncbi:MAG: hypothetical protein ACL7AX_00920 [Candidatus Arsenophonus phytopathogenicus]